MFLLWLLGALLEPALGRLGASRVLYSVVAAGRVVPGRSPRPQRAHRRGVRRRVRADGRRVRRPAVAGHRPVAAPASAPLIVINLVFTFAIPGISIGGHIGGLVAGSVGAWILWVWAPRPQVAVPVIACSPSPGCSSVAWSSRCRCYARPAFLPV